ncbi:hypothetical protein ACFX2J_033014 [Malus domestica]
MVEQFDLRPNAASNDELLYYDSASAIICAVGSRYKSYCSNIARTFPIDATSSQSKAYEVLFKAHNAAISELKPGKKVSAAYQAALAVVEKEAPELISNLTKSAGTGIGLEFRESGFNINAINTKPTLLKHTFVETSFTMRFYSTFKIAFCTQMHTKQRMHSHTN